MSPSSRALLAYILNAINPADTRVRDLISNLEILRGSQRLWRALGNAGRKYPHQRLANLHNFHRCVCAGAARLCERRSCSTRCVILPRIGTRQGLWGIGHDNAWAMMALNEAMVGFGDLNPDFTFNATLNGGPLTSGDNSGNQVLTPMNAQVPLEFLSPNSPNLLTIQREDGLGRLYYRAALQVNRPVEDVRPLDAGMRIERVYMGSECRTSQSGSAQSCPPLSTLQLGR